MTQTRHSVCVCWMCDVDVHGASEVRCVRTIVVHHACQSKVGEDGQTKDTMQQKVPTFVLKTNQALGGVVQEIPAQAKQHIGAAGLGSPLAAL